MNTSRTDTVQIKATDTNLDFNFENQTLTITYRGMFAGKKRKALGPIILPFEELDEMTEPADNFIRIGLKHWRRDKQQGGKHDALFDPLVFSVHVVKDQVEDLMLHALTEPSRFHGREFTPPALISGKHMSPKLLTFGDLELSGNDIVHDGVHYPIAGASAKIGSGVSGGAGLSLKRAAVGGFLIGGAGAVLGGLSGDSGQLVMEVSLADGRTIVVVGKSKQAGAAAEIVNEITEWSPRLARAGSAAA